MVLSSTLMSLGEQLYLLRMFSIFPKSCLLVPLGLTDLNIIVSLQMSVCGPSFNLEKALMTQLGPVPILVSLDDEAESVRRWS